MSTLIIGIGNEYRGDDAIGLLIARKLGDLHLKNVSIIEQSGEGMALMEALGSADTVIIIDASSSGAEMGTIFHINATVKPIQSKFFHYSSHAFGVAEAIELARSLNQLPKRLIIFAIEGKDFEIGGKMSIAVSNAIDETVKAILVEISKEKI
jgi:hydrogenase maturation protease